MPWYDQSNSDVRFEWGLEGAKRLSGAADVTIIVDVLSFSTCVDIATGRGASVFPFLCKDEGAKEFAREHEAICAEVKRSKDKPCLSPRSLAQLSPGQKVVLPSPNGSTIAFSIESPNILCGCLRNAKAVAKRAENFGKSILVIAAGEKWDDESLRPALEDTIGAGAIISSLSGNKSPEALSAVQAFQYFSSNVREALSNCSSGGELIERGYPEDVEDAAALDISDGVPILKDRQFCLDGRKL